MPSKKRKKELPKRLTIRLKEETLKQLEVLAQREKRGVTTVARFILERYFDWKR